MVMTASRRVTTVQLNDWDALIESMSQRTVFHSRAWFDVLMAVHQIRPVLLQVEQDGRCEAAWPSFETRKGPLRILGSPLPGWSTAYLGPLFAAGADVPAALSMLLKHHAISRCAYFTCKVFDECQAIDLAPYRFNLVRRFDTYRINLQQSIDQIWKNMQGSCRQQVRKAQRRGVTVSEETSNAFVDEYWEMAVTTFAKSGNVPTHNRQFVAEMWRYLHPIGAVRFLSAFYEGRRIATLALTCDQQTMYYWGGVSHLEYRACAPHNLLQWEAIQLAHGLGLRWYDFISTFGGPGRFKSTFGPERTLVATHWERSSSWLTATLKNSYERYLRRRSQGTAAAIAHAVRFWQSPTKPQLTET